MKQNVTCRLRVAAKRGALCGAPPTLSPLGRLKRNAESLGRIATQRDGEANGRKRAEHDRISPDLLAQFRLEQPSASPPSLVMFFPMQCARSPSTHRPSPLVQRSAPVSWQTAPCLRFLRRHAERNTNSGPTGCDEYTPGMLSRNNLRAARRIPQDRGVGTAGCRNCLPHIPRAF